ncbi:MAG: hypothetical protein ABSG68_12710 [Thermoguttaceae bacterium]|jgi:hypothetical protein
MNYLAHALPFLDDPYFAAGTAVPDWLMVVDRRVRVRSKQAEPFLGDPDPICAAVAGGTLQHILDDRRFHESRSFAETSLALAVSARDALQGESSFRPGFLGHLLVEVLLDAALAAEQPAQVESYYRALETVDAAAVQHAVNRMASRSTARLAPMISAFCRARILWDYLEDDKLLVRLNQVMRRLTFDPLPDGFADILPAARQLVGQRRGELLPRV